MRFVADEEGAVTVDWVVLTAALVGLGLAVAAQVSSGLEKQADDISGVMLTSGIVDAFDATLAEDDFEAGRGAWEGGELQAIAGFGNILALSGDASTATLAIDVSAKHDYAVVEFDMIVGDSWDNETGSITIGGVDLLEATHWHEGSDAPSVAVFEGAGDASIQLIRQDSASGTWGGGIGATHDDYTYRVRVVAANDGRDLTLGAATTLSSGASDEFFGIDNVTVTGTDRPR